VNDRAELHNRLQANTATLLGFGDNPTPLQKVKIDLVAALRMTVDKIVSTQLSGGEVNMKDMIAASEALENLLRPAAIVAEQGYSTAARDKLKDRARHRGGRSRRCRRGHFGARRNGCNCRRCASVASSNDRANKQQADKQHCAHLHRRRRDLAVAHIEFEFVRSRVGARSR
jgi:hypothetical protein